MQNLLVYWEYFLIVFFSGFAAKKLQKFYLPFYKNLNRDIRTNKVLKAFYKNLDREFRTYKYIYVVNCVARKLLSY